MKRFFADLIFGLAALLGIAACPSSAMALSKHDLSDAGMDEQFGRYGPQGNCAAGPVIEIDRSGFTFEVAGKKTHPATFEVAYSFWGNDYQGIQIAVFPFVRSADDYGVSSMTLNADEAPGKITFENSGPGPLTAVQTALAKASPFMRCGPPPPKKPVAAAPAPRPAIPLDWASLPKVLDTFDVPYDMFDKGEIAAALRALMGPRMAALETNLSVSGTIRKQGSLYYISGNAPHLGGEEQAYVLLDSVRRKVQVGLWEKGKLTVYAPREGRLPLPAALAPFLAQSPPETAVALPGTPWEIIRTASGQPLASVDAAGSPDIESFTVFCEGSRPKLAMLLNKPRRDSAMTVAWVFNGRVVSIPMGRGNAEATFWLAYLDGSPLLQMLLGSSKEAFLRINGTMQGQASLVGSAATLRSALKGCARI